MANDLVAKAETTISAPPSKVWDALVDPAKIKKYMFGATVTSNWKKQGPITWKGEFNGKAYEDKGTILAIDREKLLKYTHFSPMGGQPDRPENYHTVTIALTGDGSKTKVSLTQDKNATKEELEHSQKNWSTMLQGLKKLVES